MSEAHIRLPRVSDVDLFLRLKKVCFPWAVERGEEDLAFAFLQAIEDGSAGRKAVCSIAEINGRFAGYASARPYAPMTARGELLLPDTPVAVVPQVAVVPNYRRRGVAGSLLAHLETQLAKFGYSLAIAHITSDMAGWYSAHAWQVLPKGSGLAWIEGPSSANRDLLPPEAPLAVITAHTPSMHEPPMNAHGYDTIAFRRLEAPMRVIAASFYEATNDRELNGRRAAGSLIGALERDPDALRSIAPTSAVLLQASAMEPHAAAEWLHGRQTSER